MINPFTTPTFRQMGSYEEILVTLGFSLEVPYFAFVTLKS